MAQKPYHGDGPDDWLRFVPVASAYALKACGVESASSWKRLAINTATSYVLSCGTTWALKHAIHERRPDGTDNRAFPSGHATVAFAGAAILDKEFRHVSPWISVGGYAVATGVAATSGTTWWRALPSVWVAHGLAIGSATRLRARAVATKWDSTATAYHWR